MGARAGLAKEVHPDEKFREAGETCEQQLEAYNVELSLDRGLYDALSKVDAARPSTPSGAFWLFKTLREFRRSGVDRDEATRAKVRALNEELVKIGQTFGRNIRDDVRSVTVDAEGPRRACPPTGSPRTPPARRAWSPSPPTRPTTCR